MPNKKIAVGAKTKILMDVETSYGVAPSPSLIHISEPTRH